jgi:hypothetical protein
MSKLYLQSEPEIVHNLIWKGDQFWEDSLTIGLAEQLELMERIRWDELDADALREKILSEFFVPLYRLFLLILPSCSQYHFWSARDDCLHNARDGYPSKTGREVHHVTKSWSTTWAGPTN